MFSLTTVDNIPNFILLQLQICARYDCDYIVDTINKEAKILKQQMIWYCSYSKRCCHISWSSKKENKEIKTADNLILELQQMMLQHSIWVLIIAYVNFFTYLNCYIFTSLQSYRCNLQQLLHCVYYHLKALLLYETFVMQHQQW